MLLRVAANRAASENNADAQRTLLNKCEVLKASITKQIRELKAQERELTSLLRTVSNVAKSGERVIDTEFKTFLSELIRELQ